MLDIEQLLNQHSKKVAKKQKKIVAWVGSYRQQVFNNHREACMQCSFSKGYHDALGQTCKAENDQICAGHLFSMK